MIERLCFNDPGSNNTLLDGLGTICRRKQQHWLVDLLHESNFKMVHNRPVYVLLIGYEGNSDYERDIKAYIEAANLTAQVLLVEKSSQPLVYAVAADIHTSVSSHESFPLNTLEVMCLGKCYLCPLSRECHSDHANLIGIPLIATPAYGIREQIIFPGKNGILLRGVYDYKDFVSNMRSLFYMKANVQPGSEVEFMMKKHWTTMGQQGMSTVQKYFTSSAVLPYYDELLTSLAPNRAYSENKVCVVMRFHGGQVNGADEWYNLEESIRSIYFQLHTNWELILVPSDQSDITGIYSLLVRYNHYFLKAEVASMDKKRQGLRVGGDVRNATHSKKKYLRSSNFNKIRMVVHHEQLKKYDRAYHGQFHQHLYELTDMAIHQCSPDAQWLLVTNGDNTYHESLFNHLDERYDIIAYDFYSRWYKHLQTNLPPCDRLMITKNNHYYPKDTMKNIRKDSQYFYNPSKSWHQQSERVMNGLSCVPNGLARNRTDLGANIVNLKKWLNEGHKYSNILSNDGSHDGTMMEILLRNKWTYKQVHPAFESYYKCLFNHNPNYHSCISMNPSMYWDDSKHICYHQKELIARKIRYRESNLHHCITSP